MPPTRDSRTGRSRQGFCMTSRCARSKTGAEPCSRQPVSTPGPRSWRPESALARSARSLSVSVGRASNSARLRTRRSLAAVARRTARRPSRRRSSSRSLREGLGYLPARRALTAGPFGTPPNLDALHEPAPGLQFLGAGRLRDRDFEVLKLHLDLLGGKHVKTRGQHGEL